MSSLRNKKIYIGLCVIMALTLLAEIIFAEPHFHMPWHELAGADILIGFGGAWLLILLAKKIMAFALQRREGYYEENGGEDDA